MNLLVTGAAGFIGSNFCRYWTQTHPEDEVIGFDSLTYAGNPENLADIDINCIKANICDFASVVNVLESHQVTAICHFAAESHNSLAVLDPTRFFKTNVIGTQTLLEADGYMRSYGSIIFPHVKCMAI